MFANDHELMKKQLMYPVEEWCVKDVLLWLKYVSSQTLYPKYADVIIKHELAGCWLIKLTENDLMYIGVDDENDRQNFKEEICKLRMATLWSDSIRNFSNN
ncbi:hypothetical protein SNEBB_002992 [Seison nebaliae]|nr:hypothetical protein SNEBB_002992 [Seison nebaliae]